MNRIAGLFVAGVFLAVSLSMIAVAGEDPTKTADRREAQVYFVVHQRVLDGSRPEQYIAGLAGAVAKRGAVLVAAEGAESIEGDAGADQTVIVLWPSRASFFEFWSSEDSIRLNELRRGAARWQAQLVPALPSAP